MKDISSALQYKGREYKVVFNLNVMEAIQAEYGSTTAWIEKAEGENGGEPDAKAVIFGFAQMLNEGIDIDNDDNGTNHPPMTLKQVGRMLSEVGLANANKLMQDTIIESSKTGQKN